MKSSKREGYATLIVLILGSLLLLSLIRATSSPIGKTGEEAEEQQQAMPKKSVKMQTAAADEAAASAEEEEEETPPQTQVITKPKPADAFSGGTGGGGRGVVRSSSSAAGNQLARGNKALCFETSRRSDTCEAAGDVRVLGRSQTIHVSNLNRGWKVKPYCRKGDKAALSHVKEWTLRPLRGASVAPRCTVNSSATAFVLSTGGFTGNLFHDFNDVLIPAFITARRFDGEVQFLVSDHKSWWMERYMEIFEQLSRHEVIDADADREVRCFRGVVVGPRFHKELGVDPERTPGGRYSMADFRAMVRAAFKLERAVSAPSGDPWDIRRRPRLLIISRRATRRIMNERAMTDMAMSLGFDVRVADPERTFEVSKFARLVNSADLMLGVHGAGLTNMLFLPAGAVLVQVVPYGGLQWMAWSQFREPARDMELHYLEYNIALDETTLSEQYARDDPVLRDPAAIHRRGGDGTRSRRSTSTSRT